MPSRAWLGLFLATSPGRFAANESPLPEADGVGTRLLFALDGITVRARAVSADSAISLPGDRIAYVVGYHAIFEDTELTGGLTSRPDEAWRPLPPSEAVWRVTNAGFERIAFEALPDEVLTFALRTVEPERCFEEAKCYVDPVERFCVPCPIPEPPAPPALPEPRARGDCNSDSQLERLACTQEVELGPANCGEGIDPPSGCASLDDLERFRIRRCSNAGVSFDSQSAYLLKDGELSGSATPLRSLDTAIDYRDVLLNVRVTR